MADLDPQAIKDLKTAIAADAPVLAKLLDGPSAAVAVLVLAKTLVGDAEASIGDIVATAKTATPDVHLKIAAAEQQGQMRLRQSQEKTDVTLAQLDPAVAKALLEESTKQQQAELDDTKNARQMSIQTHDATNRNLAYIVTVMFFILILVLIFAGKYFMSADDNNGMRDILFTLFGVVATGWASIISFYFGSSTGSMQKSLTLDAMLTQKKAESEPGRS
jgi:hypothetical protein